MLQEVILSICPQIYLVNPLHPEQSFSDLLFPINLLSPSNNTPYKDEVCEVSYQLVEIPHLLRSLSVSAFSFAFSFPL